MWYILVNAMLYTQVKLVLHQMGKMTKIAVSTHVCAGCVSVNWAHEL